MPGTLQGHLILRDNRTRLQLIDCCPLRAVPIHTDILCHGFPTARRFWFSNFFLSALSITRPFYLVDAQGWFASRSNLTNLPTDSNSAFSHKTSRIRPIRTKDHNATSLLKRSSGHFGLLQKLKIIFVFARHRLPTPGSAIDLQALQHATFKPNRYFRHIATSHLRTKPRLRLPLSSK